MLVKLLGCELEFGLSLCYVDVPHFGELYVSRTPDNYGRRWFECVRQSSSIQLHLGATHIILCRPYKPTSGLDGLSAA